MDETEGGDAARDLAGSANKPARARRHKVVRLAVVVGVVVATALLELVTVSGQWLIYPTPGIPRKADGTPDLSAPAPRTADGKPDVSGLWQPRSGGYHMNIMADLTPEEIRPWAVALTKQRTETLGRESPVALCLPEGPVISAMSWMVKVVKAPGLIVMLYEGRSLDRQIFTDGRPLPVDPNPTWVGYSVGHWEGDTLVVESNGLNDKTWLDRSGHPHSDALRLTERFRRRDFGHMQLEVTIDDPMAYARPFTVPVDLDFVADTELLEWVCNENERDAARTRSNRLSAITVSPSSLARFVGRYAVTSADLERDATATAGRAYVVTVADGQLMLLRPGDKVRSPIIPMSDTHFVQIGSGAEIEFIMNTQGTVTELIFHQVEGASRAVRLR